MDASAAEPSSVLRRARPRRVVPEILDTLPPGDREAQRSRRDLRLINAAMRNRSWFQRTLAASLRPDDRVLELGPGDSRLHELAPATVHWDGIDRLPRPTTWPAEAHWHCADILTFAGWRNYSVIVANLVLHHFVAAELQTIGAQLAPHARLLLACEPARRRRLQPLFAWFCRAIGASAVTRHDGRVSIDAGFLGHELPTLLGLVPPAWRGEARIAGLGAYRLVAHRRP
ncbi:MAG TPA: hypothetical protein VGD81_21035 [Opitutaceae bacterium]